MPEMVTISGFVENVSKTGVTASFGVLFTTTSDATGDAPLNLNCIESLRVISRS